jgi:three-Cys-motif partner protein
MRDLFETVPDDGLITPEVGPWAEEKHRLLAHYATLFARAMKGKWDDLVYIDLFAGPGRCRVRGSERIYRSSPTIVLSLPDAFSSYVFCDADPRHADALRLRATEEASDRKFTVLSGDANVMVTDVLKLIPTAHKARRVLCFCFLDPYQLSNLKFATIERLSKRYVDFLVLIPSSMDANRNEHVYTRADNHTLDVFLGNSDWRERWSTEKPRSTSFETFVVSEFGRSMQLLKYIDPGLENIVPIRSQDKNLLLYRLALYSRNQLGTKFWNEAKKYANPQIGLDF